MNVKLVPLLGGKSPVAAVTYNTLQDVSLDSSATVTAVATAEVPEYPELVIVPKLEPASAKVIVPPSASIVTSPSASNDKFPDVPSLSFVAIVVTPFAATVIEQ